MLFERIMALLELLTGALRRSRPARRNQEDVYDSTVAKDAELDSVRRLGGRRVRNVNVIGPEASQDGVAYDREEVDYWTPENVQTSVVWHETRRCSCGSLLRQEAGARGVCSVCIRVVCQGCSSVCERCGALTCARDTFRLKKHVFCSRHRAYALWLLFWGMLE
jgi:hypothetical protein